jgi:hypothetical protein
MRSSRATRAGRLPVPEWRSGSASRPQRIVTPAVGDAVGSDSARPVPARGQVHEAQPGRDLLGRPKRNRTRRRKSSQFRPDRPESLETVSGCFRALCRRPADRTCCGLETYRYSCAGLLERRPYVSRSPCTREPDWAAILAAFWDRYSWTGRLHHPYLATVSRWEVERKRRDISCKTSSVCAPAI